MDRRGETVVEDLRDVGSVHSADGVVCKVRYSIEVTQYWLEAAPTYVRTELRRELRGWVQPIDKPMSELLEKDLRLELQDGRQLFFAVAGADGTIAAADARGLHFPET
jgi:hypothetical protein